MLVVREFQSVPTGVCLIRVNADANFFQTKAFEFIDLLLVRACDRVAACHCEQGCLECCCSEACHENNMVMSKAGAVSVSQPSR